MLLKIDQEHIFISYKKLLKEGENEDVKEKELRLTQFEDNVSAYKSKISHLISKIKDSIQKGTIFILLKNKDIIEIKKHQILKTF